MDSNTTGTNNVAIGVDALQANTTADSNVAIGRTALGLNTTGANNVAVGGTALDANTTGAGNVAVGKDALTENTTASNNVAVGIFALNSNTTGTENVAIGYRTLQDTTPNTTGNYNIGIGSDVRGAAGSNDHHIIIGHDIDSSANSVAIGKSGNKIQNNFDTNATWTRFSDQNLKTNINTTDLGLSFINKLRPVTFNWRNSDDFPDGYEGKGKAEMDTTTTLYGMLAQEVKTALDEVGHSGFGGWSKDSNGTESLAQSMFIYPLIKSIQELSAKLEAAEARITTLEGE